ncbi:hypothetical protein CCR75_005379 [Bremia lactucae]|uniref:Uncharacterized protein n=1 Tax=Bremia lactucae TaxID=4779 RepID=A0A976IBB7_BRELC|nr:hypothetical protein CCR75_005379 [Bremia lactucae]
MESSDRLLIRKLEDNEPHAKAKRKGESNEEENEKESQRRRNLIRQSRRHNWQPKYEMEFGLLAIEKDPASEAVLLAMCGFCKTFGREGKYDRLVQQDHESGNDSKKRRRRSLTTTKFFRAFRVDNIRSHLQGAHPRRWAEYEMLPKQEDIRNRFLNLQGELRPYEDLPIMDDVVLENSFLTAGSDMAYTQTQLQAQISALSKTQQAAIQAKQNRHVSAVLGDSSKSNLYMSASLTRNGSAVSASPHIYKCCARFDYEKHLAEQIALDRERLEFEKMRFEKEVELRERELALREKHMDRQVALQEKLCEANRKNAQIEGAKFYRLAEVLRNIVTEAQTSLDAASVV